MMDKQIFIEKFAEQFDETDGSLLKGDTKFKELDEWSSLIALTVIGMIDEEYEITIKGEDIRNADTVEDLFTIVNERKL